MTTTDHPLIGKALVSSLQLQLEDERLAHLVCIEMRNEAEAGRDRLRGIIYRMSEEIRRELDGYTQKAKTVYSAEASMEAREDLLQEEKAKNRILQTVLKQIQHINNTEMLAMMHGAASLDQAQKTMNKTFIMATIALDQDAHHRHDERPEIGSENRPETNSEPNPNQIIEQ